MRRQVERDVRLDVPDRVAHRVEVASQALVRLGGLPALARDFLGAGAEQVGGQHVELRRLVDALTGVLAEQRVAPGDEVVEVRHHRLEHVRGRPVAGDHVRPERGILPRSDAVDRFVAQRGVRAGGEVDQHVLDQLHLGLLERLDLPEPLRCRPGAVVRRVEDVVEPALRLLVPAVAAQVDGNGDRHVEEQLHVVDRVRPVGAEVEVLDRVRRADQIRGRVATCRSSARRRAPAAGCRRAASPPRRRPLRT